MVSRHRAFTFLVLILLAALAVRLFHIDRQSIWFDEGWSAYAAVQPSLVAAAAADATNPPLYYVLLNLSTRFLGDSAFALRLFSTFAGLVGVALAYSLGRALFSRHAGLFAAFLVAVSPLLWWAAQEARMYTLLALGVQVAALAWFQLRQRPARWAWLALWLAELALLYAHNTGPVVALWLNVVTLLAWLADRHARRPDWRVWLGGQALVGLLWLPYFVTRYLTLSEANSAIQSAPQFSLGLLGDVWSAFWAGSWSLVGREPLVAVVTGTLPYLGLSGLALILTLVFIPWRKAAARWLVLHALVLTAGLLLGLGVLGNELHGRYLVMVTPLLLVPVGAGLARLRPRGLGWIGAAIFAGIFVAAVAANQNPLYGHDDVRGMVASYAERLGPEDTVLAWSYADRYELAYYWPRLGVEAARVTLPEGADLDAILPLLPRRGDVALNVWYTQRADYRGMLNCVLAHGTRRLPEAFTTYGMTSLIYRAPVLDVPALSTREADFGVAQLLAVGGIPAFSSDQALCLPVHLRVAAPTGGDLQAAVVIYNALGWEVARADAIFATANQRTSTSVEPGTELAAYPLLRLPYGAPAGPYRLALRIYDAGTLSGYEVHADDAPPARELPLGIWDAVPGQDWPATGRTPEQLTPLALSTDDGPQLIGINLPVNTPVPVANGEALRLALLWQGRGPLPELTLTDSAGAWVVVIPPAPRDESVVTLDWRSLPIPAEADSGEAVLRLPDGRVLARVTVNSLPYRSDPPPYATPVAAAFPGLGRLVGFTLPEAPVSLAAEVPLTLVWQAGEALRPEASYTVFAQLIAADGQLIAQSDSLPAAGARPTTGWRPGEYILDMHTLRFNASAHPGPAALIVGLYDAATGARLPLAEGGDAFTLPVTIDVTE
jgi:4-amino-4-deoxy-L-arabinose transferase-like glycosyltransferase